MKIFKKIPFLNDERKTELSAINDSALGEKIISTFKTPNLCSSSQMTTHICIIHKFNFQTLH